MEDIIIHNLEEYIKETEKYKGQFYFRGQANINWDIEPNIFRNTEKMKIEQDTISMDYCNNSQDILEKILFLQHYGTGTRLCDITINPLVALYFSIEDLTQI